MRQLRSIGRTIAAATTLLVMGSTFAVAHAGWESIYVGKDGENFCDNPQETGNAIIRARENRVLTVSRGSSLILEAFGHGLDLVPDVSLEGITGGSARRIGGTGGAVNGAHGCGNIGSVKFQFTVGANARFDDTGTLKIGGERISVKVVGRKPTTIWSVYNISEALSATTQAELDTRRAQQRADIAANAEQRRQDCQAAIPACQAEQARLRAEREARQAACAAGGQSCSGFIVLRSCSQIIPECQAPSLSRPDPAKEGPARCLRDLGGNVTVDSSGVLIVEIPLSARNNEAALQSCLSRPLPFTFGLDGSTPDITPATGKPFGVGVITPRLRLSRSTGDFPMTAHLIPDSRFDRTLYTVLSRQIVTDAVGTTSGEVLVALNEFDQQTSKFRDAVAPLKWRVEVSPGNGISSLSTQSLSFRKSNTLMINFSLIKPVLAPKFSSPASSLNTKKAAPPPTAFWEMVAEGSKSATSCFSVTRGNLFVATGQSSGSFDVKPKEASGCDTARFKVKVWVNGAASDSPGPFLKEISFAPGKANGSLAVPNTKVTPVIKRPGQ